MSMSDPIADMLTRIRNAVTSRHETVNIPASKTKVAIAKVLKQEGFIRDFEVVAEEGKVQPSLKVDLGYNAARQPVLNGLQRISSPVSACTCSARKSPRVYGGLGGRHSFHAQGRHDGPGSTPPITWWRTPVLRVVGEGGNNVTNRT